MFLLTHSCGVALFLLTVSQLLTQFGEFIKLSLTCKCQHTNLAILYFLRQVKRLLFLPNTQITRTQIVSPFLNVSKINNSQKNHSKNSPNAIIVNNTCDHRSRYHNHKHKPALIYGSTAVSYTHLTLPTNREV